MKVLFKNATEIIAVYGILKFEKKKLKKAPTTKVGWKYVGVDYSPLGGFILLIKPTLFITEGQN